jgi:small-conductance mechanosensitive channel
MKMPGRKLYHPLIMSRARLAYIALLICALLPAASGQMKSADPGSQLLDFVKQSIEWYRHVQIPAQLSADPSDSIYSNYNRSTSQEALALIFQFSRAQAQRLEADHPSNAPAGGGDQATHLSQLMMTAQAKVQNESTTLQSLQQQAERASGKKRQTIEDQIATERSELELAQARLEALQNFNAFATTGTSVGLPGKIAELERTVPEVRVTERSRRPPHGEVSGTSSEKSGKGAAAEPSAATTSSTSSASSATNAPPAAVTPFLPPPAAPVNATKQEASNGIISRSSQLISLTGKLGSQMDAISSTASLRAELIRVRTPLVNELRAVTQSADQLAAQPQSNDPAVLAERLKQNQALTARYKQLSTMLIPLAEASVLLDAASNNMMQWRSETQRTYTSLGRALLLRVGVLVVVIVAVMVGSDFWRRAIYRYIQEQRKRRQMLLLRRIVVTAVIVLILIFGLSTEMGSLATFAGFLTAGVAVALQNVILSVAAYFFLIGRHGIHVGDRVQIDGVTGDVVDIGLVRLHLVEVDTSGGEPRPTGRIVAFSNSVVFQPSSNFFTQLPGSDFAWRRITLTLAPDADYTLAQKRISESVVQVFAGYKSALEAQQRQLERSLSIRLGSAEPKVWLRLKEAGLEIIVLYPVMLSQAAQIDDKMTHALLDAIEGDPRLRLIEGGVASIKPVDATPAPSPAAVPER